MLTGIDIKGLRGIAQGKIENLPAGLGVFVGPNGSGKSTVLEALLLAGSSNPGDAIGRIVCGRQTSSGERWLFYRGGTEPATIKATTTGESRECRLTLGGDASSGHTVTCSISVMTYGHWSATVKFGNKNTYTVKEGSTNIPLPAFGQMRWLAPYSVFQQSLPDVFSEAVTQGRRQTAKEIIRAIIPGLENLEVLTDAGNPVVHLVFHDHSVPVESSGDGVMALVRLALELAARPDGTVLIEEPEVHEHPGAIRQSAKAILEATRRNIQVLLSTHSLDFIDALVAAATPEDLSKMCAYRFALEAGDLRTTAIPGTEVARLRGEIGEDLR
jgi:energy-coupling factor transporter ATP-binding protein EcfA2